MDQQLTPGGVSFFVTALFETLTRQVGFIVPTLLEPVTVSTQITGDWTSFRAARIRVYRYESVLVVVPPPPNGVKPVGGDKGAGQLEHQGEWVLVREVEGAGPISASAGESVLFDIAFALDADTYGSVQDSYEATLTVDAAPLTFAPCSLSAATGHITNEQLETAPLYPLYGGDVKVSAAVNFGASTYGTYELVDVNPNPGGPIDINQGPLLVQLPKSQSVEFSIPMTIGADVVLQDYTFTFQESAYNGQQSQNFDANVTIAKPGFGI